MRRIYVESSAMKRMVLGLQYDGSSWQGWQTQTSGLTVQDRLESALYKFTGLELATHCAGRTDAGVHAIEQVVHFDSEIDRDLFSWVRGVNAFLPTSIAVRWAKEVEASAVDGFHARFSARARTYRYILYNHSVRAPLLVGKTGWVFRPLNVERMQNAANYLFGTHDFSAFRAVECQAKTAVKSIHGIDIVRSGDLITLTFHANAFLHHMVRSGLRRFCTAGTAVALRRLLCPTVCISQKSITILNGSCRMHLLRRVCGDDVVWLSC
jgi:tRNA pseudouridine38-40 synthase